jgi:hypothetical protein
VAPPLTTPYLAPYIYSTRRKRLPSTFPFLDKDHCIITRSPNLKTKEEKIVLPVPLCAMLHTYALLVLRSFAVLRRAGKRM